MEVSSCVNVLIFPCFRSCTAARKAVHRALVQCIGDISEAGVFHILMMEFNHFASQTNKQTIMIYEKKLGGTKNFIYKD